MAAICEENAPEDQKLIVQPTPLNSYLPSESSRYEEYLCHDANEDSDVIMEEMQPQTQRNPAPSSEELARWYQKGGEAFLSFTK